MLRSSFVVWVAGALALLVSVGCGGGSYQPSRSASFQLDAEKEIDDDDIRKAFDARPQMPQSDIRISYYTFDPDIANDLEQTFGALKSISTVYRIPPLLVTGQRRNQDMYMYGPPQEVSVKKLRLLAARAKTDVLVIVDHGYRNNAINPFVGLNMLLVPILFTPWLDTVVKGYVEAFVIDVRNGYLYAHLVQEDERGNAYTTIYGKKADEYAAEQWKDLRVRLGKGLSKLLEEERARNSKAAEPIAAPTAPAASEPAPKP